MAHPQVFLPANDLTLVRARALCGAGRLAWFELDLTKAKALLEESLSLFNEANDQSGALNALSSLIMVVSWQGDDKAAQERIQEGMTIIQEAPNHNNLVPVLANFGWAITFTSSPHALEHSRGLNEEVVALARQVGDKRGLAWALDGLGMYWYYMQDFGKAKPVLHESVHLFRELGELWAVAHTAFGIGNIAIEEGDYTKAWEVLDEAMDIQIQIQNWVGLPYAMEQFAYLAIAQNKFLRAATLLGAAENLRETSTSARQPLVRDLYERNMVTLRANLPLAELNSAWAQGRKLPLQSLLSFARQGEAN